MGFSMGQCEKQPLTTINVVGGNHTTTLITNKTGWWPWPVTGWGPWPARGGPGTFRHRKIINHWGLAPAAGTKNHESHPELYEYNYIIYLFFRQMKYDVYTFFIILPCLYGYAYILYIVCNCKNRKKCINSLRLVAAAGRIPTQLLLASWPRNLGLASFAWQVCYVFSWSKSTIYSSTFINHNG